MRGMVVADDRIAAEWGTEILKRGGNAVDAAVATAFAMSVTRPHYASLGGGGFLMYCPAPKGGGPAECKIIDYRERAPRAAHRDMYIIDGKARTDLSQDGALAVATPGVPAGLLRALELWGKRTRQEILTRPIEWASNGIAVTGHTESAAVSRWKAFNTEAKRVFGCQSKGAAPCRAGDRLVQADLAGVLRAISAQGRNGFYKGQVAQALARGVQAGGGVLTESDLAGYQPRERRPILARYRDAEVNLMPPPSAGGAVIAQMLRYAELAESGGDLAKGLSSARAIHAISHGLSLAFADRADVFGDPDFVKVPLEQLLSQDYLDGRWRSTFSRGTARIPEKSGFQREGENTTHFSVIDAEGNAVAVTTTVNEYYGSGFMPEGTGVILNNEMDDFSVQPGVPNLFGLVGAEANAVAPLKRPLSSMSPTIVRDLQGNSRIVIGAQGGPRITTSVLLALLRRLQGGMSLSDAVQAPRFHHQWRPKALQVERNGFGPETLEALESRDWEVVEIQGSGRIQALERFPASGRVWGAPDPRTEGAAVAE
jgi:gamma-glutamyltranspeptidase/glutathione hydrolase